MKQHDLTAFKKLLDERRQELMTEAVGTMHGMGMVGESRETFPDPTDRASLEGNRNLTLRIRDRERKLFFARKRGRARLLARNGAAT